MFVILSDSKSKSYRYYEDEHKREYRHHANNLALKETHPCSFVECDSRLFSSCEASVSHDIYRHRL